MSNEVLAAKTLLDDKNSARQNLNLLEADSLTKMFWNVDSVGNHMPCLGVKSLLSQYYLANNGDYVLDQNGRLFKDIKSGLQDYYSSAFGSAVVKNASTIVAPIAVNNNSWSGFVVHYLIGNELWMAFVNDVNSFRIIASMVKKIGVITTVQNQEGTLTTNSGIVTSISRINTFSWEGTDGVYVDVLFNTTEKSKSCMVRIKLSLSGNGSSIMEYALGSLPSIQPNISEMLTSAHATLGGGRHEYFMVTNSKLQASITFSNDNIVPQVHVVNTYLGPLGSNVVYSEDLDAFVFYGGDDRNGKAQSLVIVPSGVSGGKNETGAGKNFYNIGNLITLRANDGTPWTIRRAQLTIAASCRQVAVSKEGDDIYVYFMTYHPFTGVSGDFTGFYYLDLSSGKVYSASENAIGRKPASIRHISKLKYSNGTLVDNNKAAYVDNNYGTGATDTIFCMDEDNIIVVLGQMNNSKGSSLFGSIAPTSPISWPSFSITPNDISTQDRSFLTVIRKSDLTIKKKFTIDNESPSAPDKFRPDQFLLTGDGIIMMDKNKKTNLYLLSVDDESSSSETSSSSEIPEPESLSSQSLSSEIIGSESSSTSTESSSSEIPDVLYDPQIIYVILANQSGHNNLLPFSYSLDSNVTSGNSSSIPFSYSNAAYLDYSSIYSANGAFQTTANIAASSTYVPQTEESRYVHTSEIYVDIIASNTDSVRDSFVSNNENGLHQMVVKDSFVTPKFTWNIKLINIPDSSNVYGDTTPDTPTNDPSGVKVPTTLQILDASQVNHQFDTQVSNMFGQTINGLAEPSTCGLLSETPDAIVYYEINRIEFGLSSLAIVNAIYGTPTQDLWRGWPQNVDHLVISKYASEKRIVIHVQNGVSGILRQLHLVFNGKIAHAISSEYIKSMNPNGGLSYQILTQEVTNTYSGIIIEYTSNGYPFIVIVDLE